MLQYDNNKFILQQSQGIQIELIQIKGKDNQIIIVCGDFNQKIIKVKDFQNVLNKHDITYYRKLMGKERKSKTDEILVFPNVKFTKYLRITNISDYVKICVELRIKRQSNKKEHITVYKKQQAYYLNMMAQEQNSFQQYYEQIRRNLRKEQVIYRQRVKISTDAQKNCLQMKNLNPQKKEGGIFQYYYDDDGEFCCSSVAKNCLDQLSLLSNKTSYQTKELPTLDELTVKEIYKLQNQMSNNKASSCDGISDT